MQTAVGVCVRLRVGSSGSMHRCAHRDRPVRIPKTVDGKFLSKEFAFCNVVVFFVHPLSVGVSFRGPLHVRSRQVLCSDLPNEQVVDRRREVDGRGEGARKRDVRAERVHCDQGSEHTSRRELHESETDDSSANGDVPASKVAKIQLAVRQLFECEFGTHVVQGPGVRHTNTGDFLLRNRKVFETKSSRSGHAGHTA